jgi:hypothetical protein
MAFGPNPTIVSYNASVVKIYNATGSLVRFESKRMVSSILKNSLAFDNVGVVVVNSEVVGLAPVLRNKPIAGIRRKSKVRITWTLGGLLFHFLFIFQLNLG